MAEITSTQHMKATMNYVCIKIERGEIDPEKLVFVLESNQRVHLHHGRKGNGFLDTLI